jgi:Na+/melibiose symporter-like transporter
MSKENEESPTQSRQNILTILEGFIEQIQQIRKILLGVSLSAIVLGPLAIALSFYLVLHPSFFAVIESENEFGVALIVLLGAIIVISVIWLSTGIRQYFSMNRWKRRYLEYQNEKEAMDKKIASQFGLDQE